MLSKDLKFLFRTYWFYIILIIIILLFNYKFLILFNEYSQIFSNYSITLREKLYIPFSSNSYIFSNLADFYAYLLIIFVNVINLKIIQDRDHSIDKFDLFFYSKSDLSFIKSKLYYSFLASLIVVIIPYIFLLFVYPFYRVDFIYLSNIIFSNLLLVSFISSITLSFYLFNMKYYFGLLLALSFSFVIYYFILSKEFFVFYRGGINFQLIIACILFYILMLFINVKIFRYNRLK